MINKNSNIEFWMNETVLDNFIDSNYNSNELKNESIKIPIKINNNKILLTGATGFYGAYMLSLLVVKDNIDMVYCLTRNKNNLLHPNDSIINNLKHHQLYNDLNADQLKKIKAVNGDLSIDKLGLSNDDYNEISNECNLIIHSGADINLRSDYIKIRVTNVHSVKEIIKLSLLNHNKPPIGIVYISSYSVFLKQKLDDGINEFDEQVVGLVKLENIENTISGYIQSKIISEHLITKASNEYSIPYMILRVPSLFANPSTGIGHSQDMIQNIFRTVCALQVCPNIKSEFFGAPITWVANNSIALLFNDHINNGWLMLNQNRNHINVYNVNGDTQNIESVHDKVYKVIDYNEWRSLVAKSKTDQCIRFNKSLNYFIMEYFDFSSQFNVSNKTKQLLQSLGTYDDGGIITGEMSINHYNNYKL